MFFTIKPICESYLSIIRSLQNMHFTVILLLSDIRPVKVWNTVSAIRDAPKIPLPSTPCTDHYASPLWLNKSRCPIFEDRFRTGTQYDSVGSCDSFCPLYKYVCEIGVGSVIQSLEILLVTVNKLNVDFITPK